MDDVTRRRALGGAAAAGWATGGVLLAWKSISVSQAAAASIDQTSAVLDRLPAANVTSFAYRGRRVRVGEDASTFAVEVDGKVLNHHGVARLAPGRYSSMLLPFEGFPNARTAVCALIDGDGVLFQL